MKTKTQNISKYIPKTPQTFSIQVEPESEPEPETDQVQVLGTKEKTRLDM